MPNNINPIEEGKKYNNISEFIDAVSNYGAQLEQEIYNKNLLKEDSGDGQKSSLSIWFRGQEVENWELLPGVYRPDFARNESERLYKERHMAQDFRIELAGILSDVKDDTELYFLQQHYGMPTRLLDWTLNALAALFFAVSGDKAEDAAVYVMNAFDTSITQNNGNNVYSEHQFKGIATNRNRILKKTLKIIYGWENNDFPNFAMPVRPEQFDSRIKLQSGCFTFHVPGHENFSNKENRSLRKLVINKEFKKDIFNKLLLLGINEFSIYGDIPNLSKKLKRIYCS